MFLVRLEWARDLMDLAYQVDEALQEGGELHREDVLAEMLHDHLSKHPTELE